jgi:hypothetical protein
MAYKQKLGRGNSPKTGNGIPAVFLQTKNISTGDDTKEEDDLSTTSLGGVYNAQQFQKRTEYKNNGIVANPSTGEVTKIPYPKVFNKGGTNARVIDTNTKKVEAVGYSGSRDTKPLSSADLFNKKVVKSNEQLYNLYKKDSLNYVSGQDKEIANLDRIKKRANLASEIKEKPKYSK